MIELLLTAVFVGLIVVLDHNMEEKGVERRIKAGEKYEKTRMARFTKTPTTR